VADLERAIAFHDGVLGLPVKLRTERYAELQADTVLLALIETPPGDASARSDSPAIGWEVPDLDEAVAELARRGVAFDPEERATTASAAGRRRSFRDPDGHRLELVQLVPGEIRSSERTTGTTG
jgi:catechol 2,3-dioxygenase-like lactoylglutathione lyase family enzyme